MNDYSALFTFRVKFAMPKCGVSTMNAVGNQAPSNNLRSLKYSKSYTSYTSLLLTTSILLVSTVIVIVTVLMPSGAMFAHYNTKLDSHSFLFPFMFLWKDVFCQPH